MSTAFNTAFYNITVIWSYDGGQFLLLKEPGIPGKNHRPVDRVHLAISGIRTLVVIGTVCTRS